MYLKMEEKKLIEFICKFRSVYSFDLTTYFITVLLMYGFEKTREYANFKKVQNNIFERVHFPKTPLPYNYNYSYNSSLHS